MGNNLVIVAIPEEQDRVWKISSEKIPHLTLLFLGDADNNPDVEQIVQFVEHATEVSEHGQFYLDVDRRGVLGADDADVVFFNNRSSNLRWIKQFRSQLLQNQQIRKAYDSTEQFEEWHPHLTLGYPATPANELDGAFDHPIYSVCFDRIAVWMGDFDGPDFRLEWPEREFENDYPSVAYSDIGKSAVADILHVGVKGMRWGQRKAGIAAGARTTGRGLKRVAKNTYFETDWAKDSATSKVTSAASKSWAEKDVPRLNAEYKGTKAASMRSRLKNPLDSKTIEYRSRSRAAYRDRLNEEVAKLPTNVSGTRKYEISDGGKTNANYVWNLKAVDVKRSSGLSHATINANEDLLDFSVQLIFDDGLIVGFKQVPTDLAQDGLHDAETTIEGVLTVEDVLEHYGIKGMRWGQRSAPPAAVAPSATSRVPHGNKRKTKVDVQGGENHPAHEDAIKVAEARVKLHKSGPAALSNNELRDVATRLQLENQVSVLTSSKGKQFVSRQLDTESQRLAREGLQKGGKHVVKKAARGAATVATTAALL